MFYAINENFLKLYKSNCQCYFESKQHHTVKRIENIENIWKFGFRIYLILFDYIILLKQSEYVAHSSWVVFFKSRENQIFYWPPVLGHVQVIITFYFFNIIEYQPIRKVYYLFIIYIMKQIFHTSYLLFYLPCILFSSMAQFIYIIYCVWFYYYIRIW